MGSKPITAIAKMKSYENTVAKKLGDPTDPPKSVEEDVRDENSNDLLRGSASFSIGPDQVIVTPGETKYGYKGPLDTSGNYYEKLAKEEGFKNFQGTIKEYEQSKLKKMAGSGDSNVTQQQGESTTTVVPGESEVSFDYKPIIQNVDTETLRQSRKRNRITRGSGRRAEADDRRADNLESRLNKLKEKGKENTDRYKRLERKYNIKRQVADASKARFEQNVEFSKAGVNPYNTRRTEQSKKASEDTQTKSEFESKFGGNNMGIQEIKSFTPSSITFSSPTMPSSSRSASDFTGSGSYLNRMAGNSLEFPEGAVTGNEGNLWNPKGMPKKGNVNRGYKMGGYGTKNK